MKKRLTFILLLLSSAIYISSYSQTEKNKLLDSTYTYLEDKYYENIHIDSVKAAFYANKYLEKAILEENTVNIIDGFGYKSEIEKDSAIFFRYINKLIKDSSKRPNKLFPSYAYLRKGHKHKKHGNYDKSLSSFILAKKYSEKFKNDTLKFISSIYIGVYKYQINEFLDAKRIYLEVFNLSQNSPDFLNSHNYYSLLSNISDIYKVLKKYDSALFFNKKAKKFSQKKNLKVFEGYVLFDTGRIKFQQKKYQSSIDNFILSIPGIISDENYRVLSSSYNYLAKSYLKIGNKNKAFKYFLKIDSLGQKVNLIHYSQKNSYYFLSNYYAAKNDIKNQLKYINKLISVDSILDIEKDKISKKFINEYDIPQLEAEKEKIINQLKGELNTSEKVKYGFIGISVLSITLLLIQLQRRKVLKKRFKNLQKGQQTTLDGHTIEAVNPQPPSLNIPEHLVKEVLENLSKFEKKKGFIKTNITLNSLAEHLNTNSNYLSKIINTYENKNFSNYLRDLRIDYTIKLLDTDEQVRKYTIKAIANEVGFNTAESFSNAFYKKTGLKPSYYIKQLNKRRIA